MSKDLKMRIMDDLDKIATTIEKFDKNTAISLDKIADILTNYL